MKIIVQYAVIISLSLFFSVRAYAMDIRKIERVVSQMVHDDYSVIKYLESNIKSDIYYEFLYLYYQISVTENYKTTIKKKKSFSPLNLKITEAIYQHYNGGNDKTVNNLLTLVHDKEISSAIKKWIYLELSYAYIDLDVSSKFETYLTLALEIDDCFAPALELKLVTYNTESELSLIIDFFSKNQLCIGESYLTYDHIAQAFLFDGSYDLAKQFYEGALELYDFEESNIGMLYLASVIYDDDDLTEYYINKLLKFPLTEEVILTACNLYRKKGDVEQVVYWFDKLITDFNSEMYYEEYVLSLIMINQKHLAAGINQQYKNIYGDNFKNKCLDIFINNDNIESIDTITSQFKDISEEDFEWLKLYYDFFYPTR